MLSQVTRLEGSEADLQNTVANLEAKAKQQEQRIHELEVCMHARNPMQSHQCAVGSCDTQAHTRMTQLTSTVG